jgi:4-hydroxyphenylacetate 3-monooxygenase
MGIKTGTDCVTRIDAARSEVWIGGAQVEERLSEHPAFRGAMTTQAKLYDMQHDEMNREPLTYVSGAAGDRSGLSYLPPRTRDDLARRQVYLPRQLRSRQVGVRRSA